MALNVRGSDLNSLTGDYGAEWAPRENRALYIDLTDDVRRLVVPFVKDGRLSDAGL